MSSSIKQLLARWGAAARHLPLHHDALKDKLFAALPATQPAQLKTTWTFRWFALAGAALVLVLVVIKHRNNQPFSGYPRIPAGQGSGHLLSATPLTNPLDAEKSAYQPTAGPSLDIEYGAATGLGSSDVRVTVNRLTGGLLGTFFDLDQINDTREFLKTNYQADFKSRAVQKLARRLQTIIRGYGGRIDNARINSEYASLDFVLPQTIFGDFRAEIAEIVPEAFLVESEQQQNLLPEKRAIEHETATQTDILKHLQVVRAKIESDHRTAAAHLNNQLKNIERNLANVNQQIKDSPATTTPAYQSLITERNNLSANRSFFNQQLQSENQQIKNKRIENDRQVTAANAELKISLTEDKALLDNVATVTGSISIERISLFGIVQLYVPPFVFWLLPIVAFVIWRLTRPRHAFDLP